MKKYILIVSIIFISFQPFTAQAQLRSEFTNDIRLMYANGVLNNYDDMRSSLRTLEIQINKQIPLRAVDLNTGGIAFKLQINPSHGLGVDLLESIKLVVAQDGLTEPLLFLLNDIGAFDRLSPVIQDLIIEKMNLFNKLVRELIITSDPIIQEYIDEYWNYLNSDPTNRIIVVAHSQGNLFANIIAEEIDKRNITLGNRVIVISVASPDSTTFHGNFHVTLGTDEVAQDFKNYRDSVGLPPSLPANIDNDYDACIEGATQPDEFCPSARGHKFVDDYMFINSNSEQQITSIALLWMIGKTSCPGDNPSTYQEKYENCLYCGVGTHKYCTAQAAGLFP